MNETGQPSPSVWVIVLNCNGQAVLPECLETLARSDFANLHIVVSDNASTDGSPEWAEQHYPDVHLIRNAGNLGWSGANNVGIRYALARGADYIWILNNDVAVEPDCIRLQIDYAEAHPECGIVGPVIYYYDDRSKPPWFAGGFIDFDRFFCGHKRERGTFQFVPDRFRYITGCAMMVRRKVFETIGLIDERFFIYFEDTDFCLRAGRAGFGRDLVEGAVMYHKISSFSGGAQETSPWRIYQSFRSSLLFWRKYTPWWRFHRVYCNGHLGKYLKFVENRGKDDRHRELSNSVIDALWYVCSGRRNAKESPPSPAWFRRMVEWKPWVFDRLMAFRPLDLFRRS